MDWIIFKQIICVCVTFILNPDLRPNHIFWWLVLLDTSFAYNETVNMVPITLQSDVRRIFENFFKTTFLILNLVLNFIHVQSYKQGVVWHLGSFSEKHLTHAKIYTYPFWQLQQSRMADYISYTESHTECNRTKFLDGAQKTVGYRQRCA